MQLGDSVRQHILPALLFAAMLTAMTVLETAAQVPPPPTDARDGMSSRRNTAYSLIQNGHPDQALEQLYTIAEPTGWDQFVKGQASEMVGQPVKSSLWFCAAAEREPRNDQYRTRAITSLIALTRCNDAIQLCVVGSKLATDPKKRQYYDDKIKEIKGVEQALVKGAENIAKHKAEHGDQLRAAIE